MTGAACGNSNSPPPAPAAPAVANPSPAEPASPNPSLTEPESGKPSPVQPTSSRESTEPIAAATSETPEWEGVRAFIEYNSDSGDYGFHTEFGGDPWSSATIAGPNGEIVFELGTGGPLAEHGLSGVFFESAEFPLEELPLDAFLDRFPEGEYTFTGQTLDGQTLVGTSDFTHLIPEPPEITDPMDAVVSPDEVLVAWEFVTEPEGVEIEAYSVQLFPVDPPEGQDPIALNIDLTFKVPATVNEFRLLPELLQPGRTYQFELMAIVAEGNQTFSVGEFTIEDNAAEIDPAAFSTTVDNPYFPLPPGATWEYEVATADSEIHRLEHEVLSDAKSVLGIDTTSVLETLYVDGDVEETTISWYAQDDSGNVWLLGELDKGYADGEVVESATWEAGIATAEPGIVVPGDTEMGNEFTVKFLIDASGAITDRGRVAAIDETVKTAAGKFADVLAIERTNNLQPHLIDREYYAPGVGQVSEDGASGDTVELQSFDITTQ